MQFPKAVKPPLWVETITASGETVMIKQASALTVVINLSEDGLTEECWLLTVIVDSLPPPPRSRRAEMTAPPRALTHVQSAQTLRLLKKEAGLIVFIIGVKWEQGKGRPHLRMPDSCSVDASAGADELELAAEGANDEFMKSLRNEGEWSEHGELWCCWSPTGAEESLINHVWLDSLWKTECGTPLRGSFEEIIIATTACWAFWVFEREPGPPEEVLSSFSSARFIWPRK